MADEMRVAQPKEYYKKFLEKDVRPDNRELGEFRPTVLNIGCISTAEGSSLVKLGNTSVICGVKAEVAEPNPERPKEGFIVPNVELSPLCSPNFRPGPPGEQAQVLSQNMADLLTEFQAVTDKPHQAWVGFKIADGTVVSAHCTCMAGLGLVCSHVAAIMFKVEAATRMGYNDVACTSLPCQWNNQVVKSTQCVKLESLCICPGKLVWVLHIDLICLDYDGNVMDACTLALLSALKNTSLPVVTVDEETEDIKTDPTSHTMLPVASCPVSTTFIVFDNAILLVDPTREEESLATGAVTVITEGDNLCSIYKPGGTPLTDEQINKCIKRAFTRSREAVRLIDDTLCSVDR